jgi:uncharacterized hydrophobic protein (TIGR00271 family)
MAYADFGVLVALGEQTQLSPLLGLACTLARTQQGAVTVLCVTPDGERPDWLYVPELCGGVSVRTVVRADRNVAKVILDAARTLHPDLLVMGWSGSPGQRSYLLGSTLDPVTRYAPCNVAVLRSAQDLGEVHRALVPMSSGPNAPLALELALHLAPDMEVTVLNIAQSSLGPTAEAAGYEQLRSALEPRADDERVSAKVVRASNVVEGILEEAASGYDVILIGASNESYIDRQLFGNVPQTVAANAPVPAVIVRRRAGPVKMLLRQAEQRISSSVLGNLTIAQQAETYREIHRGARARPEFFTLIALAAAIATLGLLMDSAAVIIGAMVIAPLMSAILGISLGVVQGDARLLWGAANTTLRGAALAILVGTLVSVIAPAGRMTSEILSRSQPTLFDLGVALLSGAAGGYAQCRRNVSSALSGVAIAVALIPPLATVGIGLTMLDWAIATGASLLFLTNLSAIVAASSLIFLLFGFRPDPGKRFRVFGRSMIGVAVLLLAVSITLTVLTVDWIRSTSLDRAIQESLSVEVGALGGVQLEGWEIIEDSETTLRLQVQVRATHNISYQDVVELQERVATRMRRPVALALSVIPVTRLDTFIPSDTDPQ